MEHINLDLRPAKVVSILAKPVKTEATKVAHGLSAGMTRGLPIDNWFALLLASEGFDS